MSRTTAAARRASVAFVVALACAAIAQTPAIAATPTIPDESFAGESTPANTWITGGLNWAPCLTAATASTVGSIPACAGGAIDAVGDGALRLTQNTVQGGFAILDTPIDTSRGLQIEFDIFQYNTNAAGDGMSFFLIDGSTSPTTAGSYGGGMGYASYQPNNIPGLVGGYVGVAFDTYGAFSDASIGSGGGVQTPNSIAVRGSATGDPQTEYPLLSSHVAGGQIAVPTATDRDDARRHVVVTISKLNVMSIDVDYGAGLISEVVGLDLETVNGPNSLPSSLKLGFAGSTGGAYSIHEIQNFEIQTLAPNLAIALTADGVDSATRNALVTAVVTNVATTGATDGLVTVSSTLPAGVIPTGASGAGWTCAVLGQSVTCTRPGTGAERLAAGESAPALEIAVNVVGGTALPVALSASVAVLDDSSATNDTGSVLLSAAAAGAALPATGSATPVWVPVLGSGVLLLGLALLLVTRARTRHSLR